MGQTDSAQQAGKETLTLTLAYTQRPETSNRRLKSLLKRLLRDHGFRCLAIRVAEKEGVA